MIKEQARNRCRYHQKGGKEKVEQYYQHSKRKVIKNSSRLKQRMSDEDKNKKTERQKLVFEETNKN